MVLWIDFTTADLCHSILHPSSYAGEEILSLLPESKPNSSIPFKLMCAGNPQLLVVLLLADDQEIFRIIQSRK
jgi:hypothetical protein